MRLIIYEDYDGVSSFAAKYVVRKIKEFKPTAERRFTLGLPTGASINGPINQPIDGCDQAARRSACTRR